MKLPVSISAGLLVLFVSGGCDHPTAPPTAQLDSAPKLSTTAGDSGWTDATSPELADLTMSPTSVDVASGDAEVLMTVAALDEGSGVQSVMVYLHSPQGPSGSVQGQYCDSRAPATGIPTAGTWQCTVTIPAFSIGGDWRVVRVSLYDNLNNYRHYDGGELTALGYPVVLHVGSPHADATAPMLVSFDFAPRAIDVTSSSAQVTASVAATDEGIGTKSVSVYFMTGPGIDGPPQGQSCYIGEPSDGSRNDGVWRCAITIPQGSKGGDWVVANVTLEDKMSNYVHVRTDSLARASFPTTLQVTSRQADAAPPTLTSFTFSPERVNVSRESASVAVTVGAGDVGSGVEFAAVYFHSPPNPDGSVQGQYCDARVPSSGDRSQGTWSCIVNIPAHSMPGEWKVVRLTLYDIMQNYRHYDLTELSGAGFATILYVESNAAPHAVLTHDPSPREGHPIRFDASQSSDPEGGPMTYTWDFGDGSTGSGVSLSHTYPDNGTYEVTLVVSDGGKEDRAITSVQVANVAPAIDPFSGALLIQGENYGVPTGTFTDPGIGDRWTGTVDYGAGTEELSLDGKSFSLSHRFSLPGTYTVTVSIMDDDGGVSSASATIIVRSYAQAADDIKKRIDDLEAGEELDSGHATDLRVHLQLAQRAIERGDVADAIQRLNRFKDRVDQKVPKFLKPEYGDELKAAADRLIAALKADA